MEAILGLACLIGTFGCPGALVVWAFLFIITAPSLMAQGRQRRHKYKYRY